MLFLNANSKRNNGFNAGDYRLLGLAEITTNEKGGIWTLQLQSKSICFSFTLEAIQCPWQLLSQSLNQTLARAEAPFQSRNL